MKVAPKQRVKPFTAAEVKAIESAFKSDRYYAHYAGFVTFLFGTGCRFGEAAGLHRKPYAMHHTVISHALANGANYLEVAETTGHDPQILHKHYASVIDKKSVLMEF